MTIDSAGLPGAAEPWGWFAHLTVPATSPELIRKAIERGTAPTTASLARADVAAGELARRLEVPVEEITSLLEAPVQAPLVVIDGEDSVLAGEATRRRAIQAAVEGIALGGSSTASGTARAGDEPSPAGPWSDASHGRWPGIVYRTAEVFGSLATPTDVEEICRGLAVRGSAERLLGVVVPKVGSPEDVIAFARRIDVAEEAAGRPVGSLRLLLLIERAAAFARLHEIVEAAGTRLGGLIFGAADYAADLGLPSMALDHPVAGVARARLIEAAAVGGVPAYDGMTLAYPVADPSLPVRDRRRAVGGALERTFRDALAAFELGMVGKWVGHPAQLFAVELASRRFYAPDRLQAALDQVAALAAVGDDDGGVTVSDGTMIDRATDRQARTFLARAARAGRIPPRLVPPQLVPSRTTSVNRGSPG